MADAWTTQRSGNWSRASNNADSPWHDGGTQTARASVPQDTDTQTLATGHAIVFDADTSGYATGLGAILMQGNASLTASTTAGTYYLKMAGHISASAGATATINAGSSGAVYPTGCVFTIYFNGNYQINATNGITCNFYCYEPPITYLRLRPTPDTARVNKAITAVTSYNPLTLTVPSHGYSGNDVVYITGATGLTEIQNIMLKVSSAPDGDTVILKWYDPTNINIDTSDTNVFTPHTSGGVLCIQTHASMNSTAVTLNVDGDVSADPEWTRAGALVHVCNVNRGSQAEGRTISTLTGDTITLTAGLTANKNATSIIALVSRNVTILGGGEIINSGNGHILNASWRPTSGKSVLSSGSGTMSGGVVLCGGGSGAGAFTLSTLMISGGTIIGWPFLFWGNNNPSTVSGGLFLANGSGLYGIENISGGLWTGNTAAGFGSRGGGTLSGGIFIGNRDAISSVIGLKVTGGLIAGNTTGFTGASVTNIHNVKVLGNATAFFGDFFELYITGGYVYGNNTGAYSGSAILGPATFAQNGTELFSSSLYTSIKHTCAKGYRTKLLSATKYSGYKSPYLTEGSLQSVLYDRDEGSGYRAGFHGAWMSGGTVITTDGTNTTTNGWVKVAWLDSDNKPTAVTAAHVHTFEVAAYPTWLQIPYTGKAGIPLTFTIYWCKSVDGMTATPQAQIVDMSAAFTDTPLANAVMTDNTTWQTTTLTYTPLYDGQQLALRVTGTNASGTLQWQAVQNAARGSNPSSFSGGIG